MFKSRNWKTFWELFRESVIIQSAITLGIIATICILYLMAREVPQELWGAAMLILGYWFGSKTSFVQKQ